MIPRVATVALAIAVLAGCVKAPAMRTPDTEIHTPDTYGAEPEDTTTIAEDWWTDFEDPELDTLVAEALDHNRDLRAAAARIDRAAAEARIAGADLKPQIGIGLQGARQKNNFVGFPLPGSSPDEVLSVTTNTFGASLDLSWEVDLWGRLAANTRAAVADYQAVQADYAGARNSIAGQTVKSWFAVAEANQQLELAHRTVESWQRSYDQVFGRYVRGIRSALDVRLAKANLENAKALVSFREAQLDLAVRQMEILLGRYPGRELDGRADLPDPPGEVPIGLPSELLLRRPDLASAERRLAAADQRLLSASRSLYPRLTLTGSVGAQSANLEDLVDIDFGVWSLAAGLLQPLYQGGRLRANVDRSKALTVEAVETYSQIILQAYGEVESTLAREDFLEDQEASTAEASRQSSAAQRLAEDRYEIGLSDYITVLESQRRAFLNEADLLSLRRERLTNRVDLYLALGGGFERPEDTEPTP